MKRVTAGGLMVLALAAMPAGAGVKEGIAAWQQGNYAAAIAQWQPAAAAGDADAEFNLAQAYKLGHGVPQDLGQAKAWYYKAAQQGHAQAEANYGLMLFQDGDRPGAMPWLQKAALLGEPRAQYVVGTALFNGDLAGKDWPRAYAYMTRSAAAGLPQAANSLAQMDQLMPLADRQKGVMLAQGLAQPSPSQPATELTSATPTGTRGIGTSALPPSAENGDQRTSVAPARNGRGKGKKGQDRTASASASAPASGGVVFAEPLSVPTANFNPPASPDEQPPMQATGPVAVPPAPSMPASAPPAPAQPPVRKPAPVQLAKAAGGKWRVQLGAFSSAANAETAWRSAARAGLGGLDHYAVAAGGVTKLQAGPLASRATANRACARAKAGGASCFVVAP